MALDKHQQRELAKYAQDNDVSEAAALKALFPDEVPATARRTAPAPKDPKDTKEPAEPTKS